MDQNRREFFRSLGMKTAGVAANVAIPAAYHAELFGREFKKLTKDLNTKLAETTSLLNNQIGSLSSRLDAAALSMAYQQAQITLIFLLLVILFAIDGGMTLFWMI